MKCAVVVGNSHYTDRILAQLHTPDADARALADVLLSREIGGFDQVTAVIDRGQRAVSIAISDLFKPRRPGDLALLYFSGHGVLDSHGELYLAAADTEADQLDATGIPAAYVNRCMSNSRAGQQVLILDCCHSGAFSEGTAKGAEQKAITEASFRNEKGGSGRVVLTASDSMQSSWEGDRIIQQSELSLFTHFLLEGLRTGRADTNGDGWITLNELYDYTYGQVIARTQTQSPQIWTYRQQGDMVIARNPFAAQQAKPGTGSSTTTGKPAPVKGESGGKPAGSKTTLTQEQIKKVFEKSLPVCAACGKIIPVSALAQYYVCRSCGRKYHPACVDLSGKSIELPPQYGVLKRKPLAGIEIQCKLCHGPVQLVRGPEQYPV